MSTSGRILATTASRAGSSKLLRSGILIRSAKARFTTLQYKRHFQEIYPVNKAINSILLK
jgi:hypothetical protein